MRFTALIVLATFPACFKTIPPPATPEKQLPEIENPPPAVANLGQVAIDTVDGPANVEAILATETWSGTYVAGSSVRTAPVCITPCVANLPYGPLQLRFTRVDDPEQHSTETVVVGARPSIYRYDVGLHRRHSGWTIGGMFLVSFGGVGAIVGGAVGAATGSDATGPVVGLSVLAMVLGGVFMSRGREEIQAGAGHHWTPEDGVISSAR